MIEGTVALISLFGLIVLFCLKLYNSMNKGDTYSAKVIFISYAVAWIFWLLFFMSLSASFLAEDTIVTPDAETYVIESNSYTAFNMFLNLNNLLIGLISLFTFIEVMFIFTKTPIPRQRLKRSDKVAYR